VADTGNGDGRRELELFGRLMVGFVRDATFRSFEDILSGHAKAPDLRKYHEAMRTWSPEAQALAREIVFRMVDEAIHNFLWMIETHEDDLELAWVSEGRRVNLAKASDGLCGESYTQDGWYFRFSDYGGYHC